MRTWEIKDKERELHLFETALNMCGLGVNYEAVLLIDAITDMLAEKKEQFSISDACKIMEHHESMVNEYYESKQSKNQ